MALQIAAAFILFAAQTLSIRATDIRRFAPLLVIIYFQVDYLQTALFLTADIVIGGAEFWNMLAIGEVASIIKNCGLLPFIAWKLRLRSTNPYNNAESVDALMMKGVVDSLSELLVGFSVVCAYSLEKKARTLSGISYYNVTNTMT
jgi:hypothetical protein